MTPMYNMLWNKEEKLLTLTWLPGTEGMTDDDFRETLEVFADGAIHHNADRLIIDVRQFRHRPSKEVLEWRDEVTVAKYNEAGIKRQAWIWPGDTTGMGGSTDVRTYDEQYFSEEEQAINWVLK